MTATFWILAGALMALAIGMLSWPLLRKNRDKGAASRRAINTAIYRDQMAELERDRVSGSLAAEDYERAREELERRLLEDTVDEGSQAAQAASSKGVPKTAILLMGLIPVLSLPLYIAFGAPNAINAQSAARSDHERITPEKIQEMIGKLQERLKENPDDSKGWVMLGRSYKALGRFDEAEKAYAKAGSIMDTEPVLMLEQVEMAMYRGDGRLSGKPLELLNKLLKQEADKNPMVLVYAGSNAFFSQKYADAVQYWERLKKMVDPDSEDARNLNLGIAKAKELMGKKGAPAPKVLPWDEAAQAPAQPQPKAEPKPAAQGEKSGAVITGRVDIDPALKAKVAPDNVVFIFARAAQGSRMPLAVVRAKVSDLPMSFTLDDSSAMSADMRLSQAGEVNVEVRVSRSGDAVAKSGDLSGKAGPMKPGARDVKLTINSVVP